MNYSQFLIISATTFSINSLSGSVCSINPSYGTMCKEAIQTYTNFNLTDLKNEKVLYPIIDTEGLPEDFDLYVPLIPKKSFKVKAHINSVSKFVPQPFFD